MRTPGDAERSSSGSRPRRPRPLSAARIAAIVLRALADGRAWRSAGRVEFDFMWRGISMFRGGRVAMHLVIGGLALMMAPIALPMVWHPMGPPDGARTAVYVVSSMLSLPIGLWWIFKRKHNFRDAVGFIVVSDVLIVIGTASLGAPAVRICGTIYLGMIAMLVAFLLGWRALVMQCVFALAAISAFTGQAIVFEGQNPLELYVYVAPAVTMEVGLPIIVQVLVELGRLGMNRVFIERNRDTLTGVYSRQGMREAQLALFRRPREGFCVVAVLDLDSFKTFNDTYGHLAGDDMLAEAARRLRFGVDGALVSRLGGDEFLVVALRNSRYGADSVIRALRGLVTPSDMPAAIAGSVGAAIVEADGIDSVDAAMAVADDALYEAKRDPSLRLVVREASGLGG